MFFLYHTPYAKKVRKLYRLYILFTAGVQAALGRKRKTRGKWSIIEHERERGG
jgi:hypothetical protein